MAPGTLPGLTGVTVECYCCCYSPSLGRARNCRGYCRRNWRKGEPQGLFYSMYCGT